MKIVLKNGEEEIFGIDNDLKFKDPIVDCFVNNIMRAKEEDSQYTIYFIGDLEYYYYKEKEYDAALKQCDKKLEWINNRPDYEFIRANSKTVKSGFATSHIYRGY